MLSAFWKVQAGIRNAKLILAIADIEEFGPYIHVQPQADQFPELLRRTATFTRLPVHIEHRPSKTTPGFTSPAHALGPGLPPLGLRPVVPPDTRVRIATVPIP